MNYLCVPIIVIFCYLIGEIYKFMFNEKYYKLIPVVLAICGGVLGVIIYLTNKEMIFNVDNIYLAIEVGIVSGTSSTGTNQIIKKIFKQGGKENE